MSINGHSEVRPLVRWEFARDERHLICGIQAAAASAFEVAIVPLWDVGGSAVETFTTASAALRRHATIASDLRDAGWTIAAYTA